MTISDLCVYHSADLDVRSASNTSLFATTAFNAFRHPGPFTLKPRNGVLCHCAAVTMTVLNNENHDEHRDEHCDEHFDEHRPNLADVKILCTVCLED